MGVAATHFVPYVTSLPADPVDGREVFFAADVTNGRVWHLRYRAAVTGSSKWEFVGGDPLDTYDLNNVSRAATTFGDFSTAGPSITVPLPGDFMVEWAVNCGNTANGPSFSGWVGIRNAATDPADADCLKFGFTSSTTGRDANNWMGSMRRKMTVAAASDVLKMVARGDTANTINYDRKLIVVTPIRVG